MKVLDAHAWNLENKEKYPNGSSVNKVMTAYAEYYHDATIKYEYLMDKWSTEWKKYKALDIDFDEFCWITNYTKEKKPKRNDT